MSPKKGRKNVKKIEVPTDTPTEFELGDTATEGDGEGENREAGGARRGTRRNPGG